MDALLQKLELLAPRFGRASGDLATIVARGRIGDYKGVMQGCRLVLETLLRAMVTTELKQTPGKAMLDELITKFRQQANAGLVPANVLAHMGTVQAWGNLSSHDHAGSLADEGVHVGPEEVATSLNSMMAILGWYAAKYPDPEGAKTGTGSVAQQSAATQTTPGAMATGSAANQAAAVNMAAGSAASQTAAAAMAAGSAAAMTTGGAASQTVPAAMASAASGGAAGGSKGLVLGLAALALVGVAAGGYFVLRDRGGSRLSLDAFYASAHEPPPPLPCRSAANAEGLAAAAAHLGDDLPEATRSAEGEKALSLLAPSASDASAERAYLLARAQLQAGKNADAALSNATRCEGFAAAENLAGKAALQAEKVDEADAHFGKAIAGAPDFVKPRFNRALIRLKHQQLDEAISLLSAVIADNPSSADGHFWLGVGYEAKGQAAEAKAAYCKALELGKTLAADRCKR